MVCGFRDVQGVADLTLVEFLLTVPNDRETREYALQHLGNTGPARQFVDEFCRRRSLMLDTSKPKSAHAAGGGGGGGGDGGGAKLNAGGTCV
jgi:hypothetical protein